MGGQAGGYSAMNFHTEVSWLTQFPKSYSPIRVDSTLR